MELSIIIPFYNGENHIMNLLQSIKSSFDTNTSKYAVEIIIIIDSMVTDEEVMRHDLLFIEEEYLRMRIFKNKTNIGVARTRNEGIKLALGDHLLFIDQDDMISLDFFQILTLDFLHNADFILCNGTLQYGEEIHTKIYYLPPAISLRTLILDDFVRSPGQIVIRKHFINEIGFPEPAKYHGADDKFCWIWLFYMYPKIIASYVATPLYTAKIHENNYSHDQVNLVRSTLDLWQVTLNKFPLLKDNAYVIRSIRLARYRLGMLHGFEKRKGQLEYLQYKFKFNKIVRVLVRGYLRKSKVK